MNRSFRIPFFLIALIAVPAFAADAELPPRAQRTFSDPKTFVPDLREAAAASELRDIIARYGADRELLRRFHDIPGTKARVEAVRAFCGGWLDALKGIDFGRLSQEGRVDHILLRNRIEADLRLAGREERLVVRVAALVPFDRQVTDLQEERQWLVFIGADDAVARLRSVAEGLRAVREAVEAGRLGADAGTAVKASLRIDRLRGVLEDWGAFYKGYDPAFTAKVPPVLDPLVKDLSAYAALLREKLGGLPPGLRVGRPPAWERGERPPDDAKAPLVLGEPIVGDPVGRDVLLEELAAEMIVYTPEELIEIGRREYAWAEAEMKKASRELGFGDDWRAALEHVKNAYVPRGEQPALVRDLELQAEKFITEKDLVTVPPIVRDTWRLVMMPPMMMRGAPFFLGGESIWVSYPVEGMPDDLARMIMKGNGPHLSHATVFHELIPGHNLMGYMNERYNAHRALFATPFFEEGWTLHWEMLLWDLGFHATPEDRIGALFWRMHRAARIIFTLNYQMGLWSPARCVDFLVSNGHERYTAEGEVRGHVQNSTPLYQISYLIGALQLHSFYRDFVVEGKRMTPRAFHDAVLRTGPMPQEMLRALIAGLSLTPDWKPSWRFYGDVPAAQ